MEEKKMKVVMSPGAMEQIDEVLLSGTPKEVADMQEVLDKFKKSVEDGTYVDDSEPVDMDELSREDPELADILSERIHDAMVEMGEDPELESATEFFDALRHDFVEEGDDGTEYNQADAVYKWLVELAELRVYKKEVVESRAKNEEE